MIRRRRDGYQVIVYAGIDPVTAASARSAAGGQGQARGRAARGQATGRGRRGPAPWLGGPNGRRAAGHLVGLATGQRQADLPTHPQRLPGTDRAQAQARPRQVAARSARRSDSIDYLRPDLLQPGPRCRPHR
jgi:hypothetical protein